jgi:polysaccharide export outer membrane protein
MRQKPESLRRLRREAPVPAGFASFAEVSLRVGGIVTLVALVTGCVNTRPASRPEVKESESAAALSAFPPMVATRTTANLGADTHSVDERPGEELLRQLWQRRAQDQGEADYPLGPGDTIEVSVAALAEITNKVVRVSRAGLITLPLVGKVRAGGLTEEALSEEIRRRLAAEYMHDPQVNLLVREYRSRQVAVVGAVEKPGLYSLTSDTDTLLDMISLAGGMQRDAGRYLQLIPAEPVEKDKVQALAAAFPESLRQKGVSPIFLKRTEPLVIDTGARATAPGQLYLAIPARPGDVIVVPGAGEAMVEGWVERPGTYKVTANTTVSAVIAAAGGPLYAADTSAIKIIRTNGVGARTSMDLDLTDLKHGRILDPPVHDGDIIEVASSSPKLVPYGLYRLLTTVVHIGGSVPLY